MEKACIRTFKIVHNDRPDRFYEIDHTKDFETQFRPLPLIEDYHPQYPDPEDGKDPYYMTNYMIDKTCNSDVTTIHQRTMRTIPK